MDKEGNRKSGIKGKGQASVIAGSERNQDGLSDMRKFQFHSFSSYNGVQDPLQEINSSIDIARSTDQLLFQPPIPERQEKNSFFTSH